MTSIIDAIGDAESKAAAIRRDAAAAARDAIASAEKSEVSRFNEALENERRLLLVAKDKAKQQGVAIANSIMYDKKAEQDAIYDVAKRKMNEASDFILSKIKEL